ncbi:hypothetical protein J5226_05165 [Lysobacter sp. K5869]|uniref:hypothetical protein n=1 Tax=Lysobacter sp. K5869 TaxID=2820808 RepID=UPI001C064830|nr:hypothetical protein [Lysobacter sp. K5869]QWP77805.1 hypothetical protein J5226_05165 [Lysobacter sp. K5869]
MAADELKRNLAAERRRAEALALRKRAERLASRDPRAAWEIARAIGEPWYRVQALCAVAEQWPDAGRRAGLLDEALRIADGLDEINRRVVLSARPLRTMAQTQPDIAAAHIARLLKIAAAEPHRLRRAHALKALLAATSAHASLRAPVADALIATLLEGRGDRIDWLIRLTMATIERDRPERVAALLAHHGEGRRKRRFLERRRLDDEARKPVVADTAPSR